MANTPTDSFEKQLDKIRSAVKTDVLNSCEKAQYPERIDWLARELAGNREYPLNVGKKSPTSLNRENFDKGISQWYRQGIGAITGNPHHINALNKDFPIGEVVLEYAALIAGLERVGRTDVDPGEILGRLIIRELQRQTDPEQAQLAQSLQNTNAPRTLIEQLCAYPQLADTVQMIIPRNESPASLPDRLGEVKLTTELWDHQRSALAEWIDMEANGYVDMATATGKTVLGLAAVACQIDSGSLHPIDETILRKRLADDFQRSKRERPNDVLIVTTDDLLGAQWGRLFEQHCNTPPDYTRVIDGSIEFPWGRIDIRAANSLGNLDPANYRLAIFDEVHNYSASGGWGEQLVEFIDSSCPVLALTGTASDSFRQRIDRADRSFPKVFTYTHKQALADGVIPDFKWSLDFVGIDHKRSSTLESLNETAKLFRSLVEYDETTGQLSLSQKAITAATTSELSSEAVAELKQTFNRPTSMAAALKRAGDGSTAPTEELDRLASGLSNRQTHWWNLRPTAEIVEDIVADAMEENRPCLVLTRSYSEAKNLWTQLRHSNAVGADLVFGLTSNTGAESQDKKLQDFDETGTGRKILVGPGDRIGTGVDIKTVEVGVNLARPGTGVNAALIQRLGRLLRRASDKHEVSFHHVLGIPNEKALIPTDGEGFVRNVCGFISQAKEPETGGIMKLPAIITWDPTRKPVIALEQSGAIALHNDENLDRFERAYVTAILDESERSGGTPVIETQWYEGMFSDESTRAGSDMTDSSRETPIEPNPIDDGNTADGTDASPVSGQTDGGSNADATVSASEASIPHEPQTVEVDSALVALVDALAEASEREQFSREEIIRQALEDFLGPMIGGSVDSAVPLPRNRDIQIDCDPVLARLLEQRATASEDHEDVDEYIQDALYEAIGLSEVSTTVLVPTYYQYEFVINRLLGSDDCALETPADVVQAALAQHLEINPQRD